MAWMFSVGGPALLRTVPGLLLCGVAAAGCLALERVAWLQAHGLSALSLAIVLGILLGHLPGVWHRWGATLVPGLELVKHRLLRLGIVLYGLRLSVQDLAQVGWLALALDIAMLLTTFALACWCGPRWLGLDQRSAVLIGAGSAICGAAAVLATAPVARARGQDVAVAVATVVVFGTLSMVLYPALAFWLWPDEVQRNVGFGVYVGATVHEVAQVVVAGSAVSAQAAHTAVVTKMLRVLLLAPFLLGLSWWFGRKANASSADTVAQGVGGITIPWFAVGFVAVVGLHSWADLPPLGVQWGVVLGQWLLTMAMVALGLGIQWQALRRAGLQPLGLAGVLWLWLVVVGALLTRWWL